MDTDEIATELLQALDRNELIEPLTDRLSGFGLEAAYAAGAEITRRRRERGEVPIGRKLGFTNRAVWSPYGFAPFWAPVYDSTVSFLDGSDGRVAVGHLAQPRLEPEIVLHFQSTPSAITDEAGLLSHIDWIAPAFEIVQSHFPDWRYKAPDAVAAFGVHGALIVGPPQPISRLPNPVESLRSFAASLSRNGIVREKGGGANVLGSPLLAVTEVWSSTNEPPPPEPIQAGEIVSTGTLTALAPVEAGETWSVAFEGIELAGVSLQIG